ncbi:Cyclopropane-fatty-acyl-phospholipid synthase [hydrothermal vent metagenome]|uniref:Cyclopropane-fatty-acyl-phospholipid synthase n=1 Tax=hydrothermal vent metagenome TaxID=652676 RepID=A0A3B0UX13_9ZZZZ
MKYTKFKNTIETILSSADVKINGSRPWDLQIHNNAFYSRVLAKGSLGLGESYMESWWDCNHLDQFFDKILSAKLDEHFKTLTGLLNIIKSKIINLQKPSRAFFVGKKHYDIGNSLFENMLDKRMIYSCGYWQDTDNLDQAQEAKLHLVCRKLGLQPGMRVLDLGCGWGGAARFVAKYYDVKVVGITISEQQHILAQQTCKGLPVEIRMQDYRKLNEKFDRIYSLGMFEHVGYKNYLSYFKVVRKNLTGDGLFLLHTIGGNDSVVQTDPWIGKYISPNSMLPSAKQIMAHTEGLLVLEDWHNFGVDYDKTLIAWYANFTKNWDKIKDYDVVFYRQWCYYLLSCAGAFRARKNQLWQCVFSADGLAGGYKSVR